MNSNPIFQRLLFVTLLLFITIPVVAQQSGDPWEQVMLQFEELDRTNNYPPESIFFTGSSSIRLWATLEEDMHPYSVIQRGFGGSRMTDLLNHADRYISGHTFSAMVIFVANDIVGDPNRMDNTPEEVGELFEGFITEKVRMYNADAPIFILAVTPTHSRWHVWEHSRAANQQLAVLADELDNVIFIHTEDLFLDENGMPKDELFVGDRLHLSPAGYALWTKRLRSYLDPVIRPRID
jgi:hypothetical protein